MHKAIFWVFLALLGATPVSALTLSATGNSLDSSVLIDEARVLSGRASATKTSEKRLEAIVLELGERPENEAARALVAELSVREASVLVAHEESSVLIPYADVGAAARFVLRKWERERARRSAMSALRRGSPNLTGDYFAADDAGRAGILDALRAASPTQLSLYRDAVAERLREPGGDRLAAAVALAPGDERLLLRIILEGSPAVALRLLNELNVSLGADATLDVLKAALLRPDIASAALFEVGRLSGELPAAEKLLWDLLGNPTLGGSAAAALARQTDRIGIDRLAAILSESDNEMLQMRALLALRLSNDPRAAAIAADWQPQRDGAD